MTVGDGILWSTILVLFGFAAVEPSVPLLSFVFLVALGIDYNIFLMSRIHEEAARLGTQEGTRRGLATTGGVITSAGLASRCASASAPPPASRAAGPASAHNRRRNSASALAMSTPAAADGQGSGAQGAGDEVGMG